MKLRRILSVLLTLCLLTSFLPPRTVAAQAEKQDPPYTSVRDSAFYPTIEIQEVTPEPDGVPEASENLWNSTENYATPYMTVEEAALQLREYMKARKTSFDIYVKKKDSAYQSLIPELLKLASVHTGNPIEGDYLLWHCRSWGGEVERELVNGEFFFHFTVEMDYYTTAEQEQELTVAVNNLLNTLNVYDKSDYEKVKAVYDYICQNITYDYEHLEDPNYTLMFSAYAALINKTAVCQGYATLLYRLLLSLNVDCRVITGETVTGIPHAWNIIKLGNVYYNADSTWDSECDPYMFFLLNSKMNVTHYRYLDFNTIQFQQDYPMSATDYVEGGDGEPEYIIVDGGCGDDVYWGISRDGKLIISGTGATYDYLGGVTDLTQVSPWYHWQDGYDAVIVEEGITELGDSLFYGHDGLVSVTLPESLITIGTEVFRNCKNLTQIHIPDNVKNIEMAAFAVCTNLQTVILGSSLESIGHNVFLHCISLQDLQLPESLTTIEYEAFGSCHSLEKITIPKNVTKIEPHAFSNCTALTEIRFEGDAPYIDLWPFEGVTATAYYPASNPTWTEDIMQDYGGDITWEAYCPEHHYEVVETTATCTEGGMTAYTCTVCGDSYVDEETPALGHQWSEGSCDQPRSCTVCGESSGADGHVYDDGVDGTCNFCNIDRVETVDRIVVHMFRMYNPNTGEHFYTGSDEERDNLIGHGWQYEGIGFTFPANTGVPVHRLFHEPTGEHLYTMDENEVERLIEAGWNYEGVAFNSAYDTEAVQYRLYNPNTTVGAYHFTHSEEERQNLLDAGWQDQGIGWYSCWK